MWNKTPMKPLGEANLTVKNPGTGDETKVTLKFILLLYWNSKLHNCRINIFKYLLVNSICMVIINVYNSFLSQGFTRGGRSYPMAGKDVNSLFFYLFLSFSGI
jgi:hypothetical protein